MIVMNGKSAMEMERLENHLASKWGIPMNRSVDELNNEEFSIDGDGVVKTTASLGL